jgi:Uma2 family endonuclease
MPSVVIELLPQREQTGFNLRRWTEVLNEPALAKVPGRIETDRHGNIVMHAPSAPAHGNIQAEIACLLRQLLPSGHTIIACPISTADGVRAADVAWASNDQWRELTDLSFFTRAPEICVEVLSPKNSEAEIRERTALYFDAGAREVWTCDPFGTMSFSSPAANDAASTLCPGFPNEI